LRLVALAAVAVACQPEQPERNSTEHCQDEEQSFLQMQSLHQAAMPKEAVEGLVAAGSTLHSQSSLTWRWLVSCWWAPPSLWLAVLSCLAVVQLWIAIGGEAPKKPNASEVLLSSHGPVEKLSKECNLHEDLSWSCCAVERSWQQQTQRHGQEASLWKAILWHGTCRGLAASFLATLASFLLEFLAFLVTSVLPALCLEFLLESIGGRRSRLEGPQEGLVILGICAGLPVLGALLQMKIQARDEECSAHLGAALTALLSRKALRLPATKDCQDLAANFITSAQLVAEALPLLWRCCAGLLQVAALLTLLWMKIGFLALLSPLGFFPVWFITRVRLQALVPSYVAYETAARKRRDLLEDSASNAEAEETLRDEELAALWKIQNSSLQVVSVMARCPRLLVLATLGAASFLVQTSRLPALGWEETFSLFLLLQSLLRQLSVLSGSATKIASAWVTLPALEDYLKQSELPSCRTLGAEAQLGLRVRGSFAWANEQLAPPVLMDIDVQVRRGSLVAVLGTSGAGKTSLLHAAVGALQQLPGGEVSRPSSTLLLPSKPWVFEGSLRDNVLFGRDLDEERYAAAIKAASLEALDANASFGSEGLELPQLCAQVALARAAAGSEDLVLVDDPMPELLESSIDVLSGPLFAGRTRLLALGCPSISPELLAGFDSIMILQGGAVVASGAAAEVLQSQAFRQLGTGSMLAGDLLLMTGRSRQKPASEQSKPAIAQPRGQESEVSELVALFKLFVHAGASAKLGVLTMAILANQVVQLLIDWLLVGNFSLAFEGRAEALPWWLQGMAAVNVLLSLVIAAVTADCSTTASQALTAGASNAKELRDLRLVDFGMFQQVWRVLTASCGCVCLIAFIHFQLGINGMLLIPVYTAAAVFICSAYWARMPVLPQLEKGRQCLQHCLSSSLAAGAAAPSIGLTGQDSALQCFVKAKKANLTAPQWLTLRLSVCLSAVYTLVVLVFKTSYTRPEVAQMGLALTPCVMLMQSLTTPLEVLDTGEVGQAARRFLSRLHTK